MDRWLWDGMGWDGELRGLAGGERGLARGKRRGGGLRAGEWDGMIAMLCWDC